jgi:hypothetical protein
MRVYTTLLSYYLREEPPFYCEQALFLQKTSLLSWDQKRQAHPKGDSNNNFENYTAEAPHIDSPSVPIVIHNSLIKFLLVLSFVLMNDVVEYLRRHIFRSGH